MAWSLAFVAPIVVDKALAFTAASASFAASGFLAAFKNAVVSLGKVLVSLGWPVGGNEGLPEGYSREVRSIARAPAISAAKATGLIV